MIRRNYQEILERITPYYFRSTQKIAWAILRSVADYCQEQHDELLRLMDWHDLHQDFAGNLGAIGHLYGLQRNEERAGTFRAKILTRIALDSSSGTYPDLELLFNNLAGEGNWTASNPSTAVINVDVRGSISKIIDNEITQNNENLIAAQGDNLVVWLKDPIFLSFLASVLAAGVKLNITEE